MAFRPARDPAEALRSLRAGQAFHDPAGVEVVVFHDVLCAWSYLADARLAVLRAEFGEQVRWSYRGFPLRPDEQALEKKERQQLARNVRRIAREPEGQGVVADLWTGNDAPVSSLPPLIALEAARQQGAEQHDALLEALRRAAFVRGMNVTRRDVLLEVAGALGLDETRFLRDLDDPRSFDRLQEGVDDAESMGIRGAPAVIIGDEWLMQGCRDVQEYRGVLEKYLTERTTVTAMRVVH
jgi:predicted DsbA family dithiol-disulfide isomerase